MTTTMATTTADAEAKSLAHSPGTIDMGYVQALKEYADVMFKGGVAGKDVKRWEEAAAKIELGRHVGLNTFMSLANIAVIHGRPSIWGDAALALVRSKGVLEDIEETFEGEGDSLTAVCRVKRVGAKRDRVQRFSVADAKRAKLWDKKDSSKGDGPWQSNPQRMLKMRARSFALRDEFGDVLSGMMLAEEAMDIPPDPRQDVPVAVVTVASKPAATAPTTPAPTASTAPALPAVRPEADPAATREQLMVRLAEMRGAMLTGHGIADDDADGQRAAWAKVLEPFGVAKASLLPDDNVKLRELIAGLATQYDPF